MFKKLTVALFCLAAASSAQAASITFDGLSTSVGKNTKITTVPTDIAAFARNYVASGQNWSGGSGLNIGLEDRFLAWCFDLTHSVGVGKTYDYEAVSGSFSNSYLKAGAAERVSKLVNANYDSLDAKNAVQAAGFQLAIWEVAYDDDFNVQAGAFRGRGKNDGNITTQAQTFLTAANLFSGVENWKVHLLESRGRTISQNLITATQVSSVPLPAAGFMMLAGLGGLVAFRRRRGEAQTA